MPAALLEMGFISNSGDALLLDESPELFAQGIYNGIVNYFESAYAMDLNILICAISISAALVVALLSVGFAINKKYPACKYCNEPQKLK